MSSDIRSVNVGTLANDGTGDAIRDAFVSVNSNFSNIDARISTGNFGVVYSGTYIQANLTLTSLGSTTTETLEVHSTANIAGNVTVANLGVTNYFTASTITSTGNTTVNSGLTVNGPAHLNNNLVVAGNLTVLGNSAILSSSDLVIQDSLINLHTPADNSPLTIDDGKDIGIKFHFYKDSDKHAALVWANDSQSLEYYSNGIESAGNTFTGTYGNVKIGSLHVVNTTPSTSRVTGAIIAAGGIGTSANIYAYGFNGNLDGTRANVNNLSVSGSVVGSLYFTGSDTIYINGSAVATSAAAFTGGIVPGYSLFQAVLETRGNLYANSRVASTSTTTGALVVQGGVGISGIIYAGAIENTPIGSAHPSTAEFTTLTTSALLKANSGVESTNVATGALIVRGGLGVSGNLNIGGSINNTSIGVYGAAVGNFTTIGATYTGSGVFTTLRTTSTLSANSGTSSTNITTGALVVSGGAGISGDLNVGGSVNSTFAGTAAITSGSITGITGSATTFTATNFSSGNIVGVLNGTATTSNVSLYTNVTGTTTNANYYLTFTDRSTTGNSASYITPGIKVNPSTNTITATSFSGNTITATSFSGNITTAAQTNITSLGILTGLTVSGNIVPNGNATVNLGSTSAWFGNIYGVSSQAKYADLAEKYQQDEMYPAGAVVIFGGEEEITSTTEFADTRVAGVISTNPAYLMNGDLYQGQAVALRGRVPCFVVGKVAKGDLLVTSTIPGYAASVGKDKTYGPAVFAKSLNDKDDDGQGQIEAVIL